MLENDLTIKQIVELRIKCLELAIEKRDFYLTKAAEEYYNFIIKNTSSSRILEDASEFISKAKEFTEN